MKENMMMNTSAGNNFGGKHSLGFASQAESMGLSEGYPLPALEVRRIRALRDQELLSATKSLADREREITMLVLRHLEEIERRKLFADLRYPSLYEYVVRELKYSGGAAQRRISAMRLLREIPQIEEKIESGTLTLCNLSQAQSYFREVKKAAPERALKVEEKLEVLAKLEDKSSREGKSILISMAPPELKARMQEGVFSPEQLEVKCQISDELREKLKEFLSLLGPKGTGMSFSELLLAMATEGAENLKGKRFGKRRVAATATANAGSKPGSAIADFTSNAGSGTLARRSRYISKVVKHRAWVEAKGQCVSCGSKHHLQYDHIEPHALGGNADSVNIQLLCASCNLRRGVKTFGVQAMRRI